MACRLVGANPLSEPMLLGPLGTNCEHILIEIQTFLFKKIHLKMSSGKWWPFCLGLNVLLVQLPISRNHRNVKATHRWPLWRESTHHRCISVTYWCRVTYICVSKIIIVGSDNGLSPAWHHAIIWNNAKILLLVPLEINFNEIVVDIDIFHSIKSIWKCRGFHFT